MSAYELLQLQNNAHYEIFKKLSFSRLDIFLPRAWFCCLRWSPKVFPLRESIGRKLYSSILPASYCVESLLVCSKNGRDTHTDRQTDRFHRYIVVSPIGAHMFAFSKIGRDTRPGKQTVRFRCYIVVGPIGAHTFVW